MEEWLWIDNKIIADPAILVGHSFLPVHKSLEAMGKCCIPSIPDDVDQSPIRIDCCHIPHSRAMKYAGWAFIAYDPLSGGMGIPFKDEIRSRP